MITILVTGSNGQLGSELRKLEKSFSDLRFIFTDIDEMDITDYRKVQFFIDEYHPSYVINTAGYTAVDRAEKEAEKAMNINFHGTANLVSALSSSGGKFIQISTDFIFNGESSVPYKEDHPAMPISVYGRSKLAGEDIALSYNKSLVIRTSWLYSSFGNNFLKTVLKLATGNNPLRIVNDQTGSPTYAADLAEAIVTMILADVNGDVPICGSIYNYSNTGHCTWFEFATAIIKHLKLDVQVFPILTSEYPLPAQRPAYSVLDTSRIISHYSLAIPFWDDSLKKCLELLKPSQQ